MSDILASPSRENVGPAAQGVPIVPGGPSPPRNPDDLPPHSPEPDLEGQEIRTAMRTAKASLTRRLRAYQGMLQRDYTQQELVDSYAQLLAACALLEGELVNWEQGGLDTGLEVYLDGIERVGTIRTLISAQYEELLAGFVVNNSTITQSDYNQSQPAESLLGNSLPAESIISATEAAEIRAQLAAQEQADLRALRREARERQRALRAEAEAQELRRQEEALADLQEAREDALIIDQHRVRAEVNALLSGTGSGRGSRVGSSRRSSVRSRTGSVSSGMSSRRSLLSLHGLGRVPGQRRPGTRSPGVQNQRVDPPLENLAEEPAAEDAFHGVPHAEPQQAHNAPQVPAVEDTTPPSPVDARVVQVEVRGDGLAAAAPTDPARVHPDREVLALPVRRMAEGVTPRLEDRVQVPTPINVAGNANTPARQVEAPNPGADDPAQRPPGMQLDLDDDLRVIEETPQRVSHRFTIPPGRLAARPNAERQPAPAHPWVIDPPAAVRRPVVTVQADIHPQPVGQGRLLANQAPRRLVPMREEAPTPALGVSGRNNQQKTQTAREAASTLNAEALRALEVERQRAEAAERLAAAEERRAASMLKQLDAATKLSQVHGMTVNEARVQEGASKVFLETPTTVYPAKDFHPPGYQTVGYAQQQPTRHLALPPPAASLPVVPAPPRHNPVPPRSSNVNIPEGDTQNGRNSPLTNQNDYLAVIVQQNIRKDNPRKFSGCPLTYQEFLLDYQQCTAGLRGDPRACLNILRNMVEGKALQSINRSFVASNPQDALREALDILERSYGTARKQVRAQIEELKKRPSVSATEAGLLEFEGELIRCYRIMERCNRTHKLEEEGFLRAMLRKLPQYMQDKWESKVDDLRERGEDVEPSFQDLVMVVRREHRRKTGDINQWREEDKQQKKKEPKKDPKLAKVNATKVGGTPTGTGASVNNQDSGQNNPGPSSRRPKKPITCPCGLQAPHATLDHCPAYRQATDLDQRRGLIREHNRCFRCLGSGHFAKRCRKAGPCGVNNCGRSHHPSLHAGRGSGGPPGAPAGPQIPPPPPQVPFYGGQQYLPQQRVPPVLPAPQVGAAPVPLQQQQNPGTSPPIAPLNVQNPVSGPSNR